MSKGICQSVRDPDTMGITIAEPNLKIGDTLLLDPPFFGWLSDFSGQTAKPATIYGDCAASITPIPLNKQRLKTATCFSRGVPVKHPDYSHPRHF